MTYYLYKIGTSLLLLMFVLSGAYKIYKLGCCEHKPLLWLGFSESTANIGVLAAGLLEVLASLVILYYVWGGSRKSQATRNYARYSLYILIGFVVVVTLLYKIIYTFKFIPLLANVSVLGGLLLLLATL